jgi:maltose O-acetyltransferase
MQRPSKFKILGNKEDISFGINFSITREPWPFFDVKGGGIQFGDNVIVSAGVNIFTHTHQFEKQNWRELDEIINKESTMINDNVFLGVNAIITHTCKYVGKCSVIGAGSVVTKNVPDYQIWAGNPAKKIGNVT